MTEQQRWRKSRFSNADQCVEIAGTSALVAVRNSHHPDAGTLTVTRPELGAWIDGVRAGQLDDLTA